MNYYLHEGEIIVPDNAHDQSLNIFGVTEGQAASALSSGQPPEFSFVVSRQPLPDGQTVHAYTDQQLKGLPQALRGFDLVERSAAPISGQVASMLEFTWQSDQGPMHQRLAILACGPTVLTFTGTTRELLREKYRDTFNRLIYSFKVRV